MTTTNEPRPFKISIQDEKLDLLRRKLELTTFPDELEDSGRDYGPPLSDIKRLVARWKDGYDWRKHEAALNAELPQFTQTIAVDGHGELEVHFVHKRSEVEGAIPLLFVHGWPGSFIEVRKILPLLVDSSGDHPSFHAVALSLPGFGFSSAPTKKGFGVQQHAEASHKLMLSLGYDEYVTQGGDWGFHITNTIAATYGGKHSKAWHTNFPHVIEYVNLPHPPSLPPPLVSFPSSSHNTLTATSRLAAEDKSNLTDLEKAGLERTKWFQELGRGYSAVQGTQPQTLGYSLADSPVGLLAWIYEKLVNWSDGYPWEDDEGLFSFLTWISVYWFSAAGPTASLRIYYEKRASGWKSQPTEIPMGFSYFPRELFRVPARYAFRPTPSLSRLVYDACLLTAFFVPRWLKALNLVFESEHTSGGHFAAHEKPDLLVGDLRKMFGRGGPAFGVVSGKTGYA
ncbi:hypothetical protein NMY22_g7980 [Coprinellus aureogranulatus]|nr:hypothetical protein NMY22_g7980 [Coprinellus aureogranulatus]